MQYQSTRGGGAPVPSAQAIAQGICGDGGLFVPERFPSVTEPELARMESESYPERAERILTLFLSDFTEDEIRRCVSGAYETRKFSGGYPAPLYFYDEKTSFLELWHGPTCAFKDMALQLLPYLLTASLKKNAAGRDALILVATSGDTGKAALEGFRDVEGTRVLVFYPENGVSALQKLQMRTQEGSNVSVCAVKGNFDDAQTGVKRIFSDPEIRKALDDRGLMFSSANSINWGRLLPQIVYYFSAYCDLVSAGRAQRGESVNFVVPTGNFGNILAAYYAKMMGLPVNKLVCASNSNNVLTDFLRTGVYNRNRRFMPTISPSMDILVSSNLERLLFELSGRNAGKVSGWMGGLAKSGEYRVGGSMLEALHELFYADFCDDGETRAEIRRVYEAGHYLCDPHTAVAAGVCRKYRGETGDADTPTVIVSTASPYKFAPDVLEAVAGPQGPEADEFGSIERLSSLTGTPVPDPIAALQSKPVRFHDVCSKEEMGKAVLKASDVHFLH